MDICYALNLVGEAIFYRNQVAFFQFQSRDLGSEQRKASKERRAVL